MILSIDQGTTSTRAIVYQLPDFQVVGTFANEIQQYYPAPGWVEHDAEEIWQSVAHTVGEAIARAGCSSTDLTTIGITNQRETIVIWDATTGKPVGPALVWQDRRTTTYCAERQKDDPWLTAKTGLRSDPYFSASKLAWMIGQYQLRSTLERRQCLVGTIDSFLLWRLTGGQVHATDITNACRTLLCNIQTGQWDQELADYFGIPLQALPAIHPSAGHFGNTANLGFLPAGIPISGIAGDQQAALYGHGLEQAGFAKCTYGTGAFMLLHTGKQRPISKTGLLTTVAATANGELNYALEGNIYIAGAAIQWLRDALHLYTRSDETENLAQESNPDEPIVHVPAFVGLGAPYWQANTNGAIFGITRSTSIADFTRATLEGVAHQVADLCLACEQDTGSALQRLSVDGGMARNLWFLTRQADLLGIPITPAISHETTALGAAMLAGYAQGLCPTSTTIAAQQGQSTVIEPTWSTPQRTHHRRVWQAAIEAVIGYTQAIQLPPPVTAGNN
ncbi:MAG: glycerol kinase GlpK [Zavarzinella sp.]